MEILNGDLRKITKILLRYYCGGKVLEIAAGPANLRHFFSDYVGTDLPGNPYSKQGNLNLYCDARFLPFKMESFALAFVKSALYLVPEPDRVLRGLWRVLKHNGRLLIFDYTKRTQLGGIERNRRAGVKVNFALWEDTQLAELLKQTLFEEVRQIPAHSLFMSWFRSLRGRDPRWLIFQAKKK